MYDPRGGGLKYIGQSAHPVRRLAEHRNDKQSRGHGVLVTLWLKGLAERGIPVQMRILDWVPEIERRSAELRYIREAREEGIDLLNINPGSAGSARDVNLSAEARAIRGENLRSWHARATAEDYQARAAKRNVTMAERRASQHPAAVMPLPPPRPAPPLPLPAKPEKRHPPPLRSPVAKAPPSRRKVKAPIQLRLSLLKTPSPPPPRLAPEERKALALAALAKALEIKDTDPERWAEIQRRRGEGQRGKPKRKSLLCKNGHERTPENTIVRPSGARHCRPCDEAYREQRKQHIREAGAAASEAKRRATYCKNGHLRTAENTIISNGGYRQCLECDEIRDAAGRTPLEFGAVAGPITDYLTGTEATQALGIAFGTLYSWMRQGRLRGYRQPGRGRCSFFLRDDIDRLCGERARLAA